MQIPCSLRVVTHYAEDDEDCRCDHYSIEVVDAITGERLRDYADWYHDKSSVKVETFIDTINWIRELNGLDALAVEYEDIADGRMCGDSDR